MQNVKWIVWLIVTIAVVNAVVRLPAAETNDLAAAEAKGELDPRLKLELRMEQFEKLTPQQLAALQKRRWDRIELRLQTLRKKKDAGKLTQAEKEQLADLELFKKEHTKLVLQPLVPPTSAATNKQEKLPQPKTVPMPGETRTLKRLSPR